MHLKLNAGTCTVEAVTSQVISTRDPSSLTCCRSRASNQYKWESHRASKHRGY